MIRRVETGGTKVSFWTITRALRRRRHHCLRRRYGTRRQAGYQAVRSQNLSRARAKSAPADARRMQSRERRGSTIRSRYRQSARPDWRRPHRLHRRSARRSLPGSGGCLLRHRRLRPLHPGHVPERRHAPRFGQHVREYEVLPGNGARTIRFALHGGYCGGHGNPSCVKTHRITGQPFKFVMPQ